MEKYRSNEKRNEALNVEKAVRKMSKVALVAAATAGVLNFMSKLDKEVMDTKRAEDVEELQYDGEISIVNGPKVRRDPEALDDGSTGATNELTDLGDSEQKARFHYEGQILVYDGPNDANGNWYGFPAEKFTETLHDAGCIDEKTEEEIVKRDKDGYVWVNGSYVELHGAETEDTGANS